VTTAATWRPLLLQGGRTSLAVARDCTAVLIAMGRRDNPHLQTVLGSTRCLLSGVLALLLWDLGARGPAGPARGARIASAFGTAPAPS